MMQIIPETGMSADFENETFLLALKFNRGGIESVIESIRRRPLNKYTGRFSQNIYDDVVTAQNERAVEKLDELIEHLNGLSLAGTLSREKFVSIYNEIQDLIRGTAAEHIE